jgi:hypothetical protein
MKVYIYIDGSDVQEFESELTKELDEWISINSLSVKVVNSRHERTPDLLPEDMEQWDLGINFNLEPFDLVYLAVDKLYCLGKKYGRDFVFGLYSEKTGISEDVLFFGADSGPQDIKELKNVLGIHS